jgi:hypothetical protein
MVTSKMLCTIRCKNVFMKRSLSCQEESDAQHHVALAVIDGMLLSRERQSTWRKSSPSVISSKTLTQTGLGSSWILKITFLHVEDFKTP